MGQVGVDSESSSAAGLADLGDMDVLFGYAGVLYLTKV